MGYIHYWTSEGFTNKEWDQLTQGVKEILAKTTVPMADGAGEAIPLITDTTICLNGVGDDVYETFDLTKDSTEFGFCKTAHKPYDEVVVAILQLAKDVNNKFVPTSDGGDIFS